MRKQRNEAPPQWFLVGVQLMPETLLPPDAAPPPDRVPAAGTPGLTIIVAVVIVAALYYGREVLIPITLAVLLSFVLSPLVELLRRAWLGRTVSVVLAVLLALGVILGFGTVIGTQVAQLASNLPQYQSTIEDKVVNLRAATVDRLSGAIAGLGRQLAPTPSPPASTQAKGGAAPQTAPKPVPVVTVQPPLTALQIGEKVLSPILNPLATAGIILVVTIFALLQKEDLRDRAIRLLGAGDLERTTAAMNDAGRRLSRYFLTQLGINASFGVIVAIGLVFIGVPNPVLWGVLGGLLRFIPYIGSWIAAALPIALAAAVEPGWGMVIWTVALYVVTEIGMGQVAEPLVYGHSTGLSPLAVIVAAIFWTWIWGPIGLIISTPITLCLVLLGRYVERLDFLDVLLGDQPPLTPAESFYQRLLAGDPDEAGEQAEQYLRERPLSSYYDEVALRGLRLATNDFGRGALAPAKLERFKEGLRELIGELDAFEDAGEAKTGEAAAPEEERPGEERAGKSRLPPHWRGEAAVLCVAGRGPLDEAASQMLCQLLGKAGLGARVVPHDAVSRTNIAAIDMREVAMICVSSLDIRGNSAHMRFLLRRLREHRPQARLLLGLWPADAPVLSDPELQRAIGADRYVSSLREAVDACGAAASDAAAQGRESAAITGG